MRDVKVPWLTSRLLAVAADPERRAAQLGDLAEEHSERWARDPKAANRWYRSQALRSIGPRSSRAPYRLESVFL